MLNMMKLDASARHMDAVLQFLAGLDTIENRMEVLTTDRSLKMARMLSMSNVASPSANWRSWHWLDSDATSSSCHRHKLGRSGSSVNKSSKKSQCSSHFAADTWWRGRRLCFLHSSWVSFNRFSSLPIGFLPSFSLRRWTLTSCGNRSSCAKSGRQSSPNWFITNRRRLTNWDMLILFSLSLYWISSWSLKLHPLNCKKWSTSILAIKTW